MVVISNIDIIDGGFRLSQNNHNRKVLLAGIYDDVAVDVDSGEESNYLMNNLSSSSEPIHYSYCMSGNLHGNTNNNITI